MMQACIFNIQRYSLHDGGGIRTIVFFKGCPFHCPWCCNPESLSKSPQIMYRDTLCMNCSKKINNMCETSPLDCPTGAKEIIGEMKSVDEVFDVIKRDYPFYESSQGGITLSGGECLLNVDFIISLLKKCKENNIHTAIETTLAIPIDRWDELVPLCDVFLVDFKIMDENISKKMTGIDVQILQNNVQSILQRNGKIIPRIPLIPTYTTTDTNLKSIISILNEYGLKEIHLLPFHQLGEGKYQSISLPYDCHTLAPLSENELEAINTIFIKAGFKTIMYGN